MKNLLKIQRRIPKQARALAKYESILDACTRVLTEQGYRKATVTELSLESDVPIATLYQYFQNKDAILVAWIERLCDQILSQLTRQKSNQQAEQLGDSIVIMVSTAMKLITDSKNIMAEVFHGAPHILTARLLTCMESKTTHWVNDLFSAEIKKMNDPELDYSLRLLVRTVLGFLLNSVLNDQDNIDCDRDGKEISLLIQLYLKEKGFLPN